MLQPASSDAEPQASPAAPQLSYTRLAMRNMVRKGRTSLLHFTLTSLGLIGILVGLAFVFR
ncbi:MAG: DUF3285 domain-containing protein [Thermostichus sp. DRC_bins_24]